MSSRKSLIEMLLPHSHSLLYVDVVNHMKNYQPCFEI